MILGIMIKEADYLRMDEKERLALLDQAYFRARQTKMRAEKYVERLDLIRYEPEEKVLSPAQLAYVDALCDGLFD